MPRELRPSVNFSHIRYFKYAAYFSGVGTEKTHDFSRLAKSGKVIIGKFEGVPTNYTTGRLEKLSGLSSYCTGDGITNPPAYLG